jgi:hypothetical protein
MQRALLHFGRTLAWFALAFWTIGALRWVLALAQIEWTDPAVRAEAWAILPPGELLGMALASVAAIGLSTFVVGWTTRKLRE